MLNFVSYLAQVEGSKVLSSRKNLAVNNDPLEDLAERFLFCREIKQLLEYMHGQGTQAPFNSNSLICSMSIPRS